MVDAEQVINGLIYKFPCLFRGKNHEISKQYVLHHLLVCNGNGYVWHNNNSELTYHREEDFLLKSLPDRFYERNLWKTTISKNIDLNLGDRYHYFISNYLVVEAETEDELTKETDWNPALAFIRKERFEPNIISNYSAIWEIHSGKTTLGGKVQANNQWKALAVEHARWLLPQWIADPVEPWRPDEATMRFVCQSMGVSYIAPQLANIYGKEERDKQVEFLKEFIETHSGE